MTPRTPEERVREFMAGVPERVVVTAHVHVSYDRQVGDVRLVGPGSVGPSVRGRARRPLGDPRPGRRPARDAVRPRGAAELYRASGIPRAEEFDVEALLEPITRDEIIADAEERVFAG